MSLEQSPIAELVRHLYAELEARGLRHFKPRCYLSDEWGSPSGEPVIGIPFYLGDPRVATLEDAINDIEGEREIMMYLRHEAGHAFNHAYELYRSSEWRKLFGSTRKPYRDDYPFVPSRATSSATSPAGTRRNIPMRTSRRRSRCGSIPSRCGSRATPNGAR